MTEDEGPAQQPADLGSFNDEGPAQSNASTPLYFDPVCIVEADELLRYTRMVETGVGLRKDVNENRQLKEMARNLSLKGTHRKVVLAQDWAWRLDALEDDMPAFAAPIDFVRARCRLRGITRQPLRIPPMLLAGRPGVGKSHFALRLASTLGVPSYLHSLQTAETVSDLTGSDKHWSNSEPGILFREIVLGRAANPLVVLDELDKARQPSSAGGYAPARELLGPTEVSTSRRLRDKSVDLRFDASYAIYVACVNAVSPIEKPLLSRFRIFLIGEPDARARIGTARSVAFDVYAELNLTGVIAAPSGAVLQEIATIDTARLMRRVVEDALVNALEADRRHLVVGDLRPRMGSSGVESEVRPS